MKNGNTICIELAKSGFLMACFNKYGVLRSIHRLSEAKLVEFGTNRPGATNCMDVRGCRRHE